ncbi:unnamed protein product [Cyprideis torosa]|uniref:Uncharacterized protein n=1 Tax=Cyprideis torosa TaxID=163714 RepID=A0A7R8ZM24_9CRUS|nr:unnamed protein product [Cyprideis torosa]CAG0883409.1 unnamed protein product [Cyprideis torosa]
MQTSQASTPQPSPQQSPGGAGGQQQPMAILPHTSAGPQSIAPAPQFVSPTSVQMQTLGNPNTATMTHPGLTQGHMQPTQVQVIAQQPMTGQYLQQLYNAQGQQIFLPPGNVITQQGVSQPMVQVIAQQPMTGQYLQQLYNAQGQQIFLPPGNVITQQGVSQPMVFTATGKPATFGSNQIAASAAGMIAGAQGGKAQFITQQAHPGGAPTGYTAIPTSMASMSAAQNQTFVIGQLGMFGNQPASIIQTPSGPQAVTAATAQHALKAPETSPSGASKGGPQHQQKGNPHQHQQPSPGSSSASFPSASSGSPMQQHHQTQQYPISSSQAAGMVGPGGPANQAHLISPFQAANFGTITWTAGGLQFSGNQPIFIRGPMPGSSDGSQQGGGQTIYSQQPVQVGHQGPNGPAIVTLQGGTGQLSQAMAQLPHQVPVSQAAMSQSVVHSMASATSQAQTIQQMTVSAAQQQAVAFSQTNLQPKPVQTATQMQQPRLIQTSIAGIQQLSNPVGTSSVVTSVSGTGQRVRAIAPNDISQLITVSTAGLVTGSKMTPVSMATAQSGTGATVTGTATLIRTTVPNVISAAQVASHQAQGAADKKANWSPVSGKKKGVAPRVPTPQTRPTLPVSSLASTGGGPQGIAPLPSQQQQTYQKATPAPRGVPLLVQRPPPRGPMPPLKRSQAPSPSAAPPPTSSLPIPPGVPGGPGTPGGVVVPPTPRPSAAVTSTTTMAASTTSTSTTSSSSTTSASTVTTTTAKETSKSAGEVSTPSSSSRPPSGPQAPVSAPKEEPKSPSPSTKEEKEESKPIKQSIPAKSERETTPKETKKTNKAVVKPHVLTHVIDGFVIQEGPVPFPDWNTNYVSPVSNPATPPIKGGRKRANKENEGGSPPAKKAATDSSTDSKGKTSQCESCGKPYPSNKGKGKKGARNFCSTACAKKYGPVSRSPSPPPVTSSTGKPVGLLQTVTEALERMERKEAEAEEENEDLAIPQVDISKWTVDEVTDFVKNIPGCTEYAEDFQAQEIDGQALILLKEEHLMQAMNMKLGPALKICSKINAIRGIEPSGEPTTPTSLTAT